MTLAREAVWVMVVIASLGVVAKADAEPPKRPTLYVEANLSDVSRVRSRIESELAQLYGKSSAEEFVAELAVRQLSASLPFNFVAGECPDATAVCQITLMLVPLAPRPWPSGEVGLTLVLHPPAQPPIRFELGRVLDAYPEPNRRLIDGWWLRRNLEQLISMWSSPIAGLVSQIPIDATVRAQNGVIRMDGTYLELGVGPDRAVFRLAGTGQGGTLFRPCESEVVEGPEVRDVDTRCDELKPIPGGAPQGTSWGRIYLKRYWGAL